MKRTLCMPRYGAGFTMVELLIVVVVLALLTVVSGVAYTATMRTSRDGRRKVDIETIRSALEIYRADNSTYPVTYPESVSTAVTLRSVLDPVSGKKYISMPKDPKTGDDYVYVPAGCEDIGATRVCNDYLIAVSLENDPKTIPERCAAILIDNQTPCTDTNGNIVKCTYCADPYGVVMPVSVTSPDIDLEGQKNEEDEEQGGFEVPINNQ